MSLTTVTVEGFRHEALLYAGWPEYVTGIVPFIREGLAAGEPVFVVESAVKISMLRSTLGAAADRVMFADMAQVGANPARIIPAWQEFVDRHAGSPQRLRGIGEPIWKGRSEDELIECQRHEALLNVAFGQGRPWWLLCPYDTSELPAPVIEEADRSHEFVRQGDSIRRSSTFKGGMVARAPLDGALPEPASDVIGQIGFGLDTLGAMRQWLSHCVRGTGVSRRQAVDIVAAVNEVATNSVVHGGGVGGLRVWLESRALICEIRDKGTYDQPLVDRRRPGRDRSAPRGLWVANQLCDLMQTRSGPEGTAVRLRIHIEPGRGLHVVPDPSELN